MSPSLASARRSVASVAEFEALLHSLPGPDEAARAAASEREPCLIKPRGSMGVLEPLVATLAAWQHRHPPKVETVFVDVFIGAHGIAEYGVSAYPPEVTAQMAASYEMEGAAINQLARSCGARLRVTPIELDTPTRPFHREPAMSPEEFVRALNVGLSVDLEGADLLCIGETGIGNTTCAAALALALFGGEATDWTGPGSGVRGEALANKARLVSEAVALHRPSMASGLDILRCLGGRELAAMAGATVAARLAGVPVVLDGFTTCAAVACLQAVEPGALDHCVLGHLSREPGHGALAAAMGFEPLLRLGMALGEATGAVMAVPLLRAACFCHANMATFEEAGVSGEVEGAPAPKA
ncbi:nicotinate-nucleotide--dimethylbenzimidazole phosphoribosyltransferase [Phaeovibrio sulfidiphilus]|uniref:Nicotinate-nucleotide--dimethylbenzimidazole phosphoribosyltransferase n=1 Tax=Phaeovibrio sulfidiphilus TaxID=1220600 RepID=A0A8J7CDF3_9PROT|nr:nicotinate-nucleotide--dimethylbenzimidazole phosphoribosyltransferase [Phaeovibrio sulfidiphilus]MBE1237698.1 nicotinate-nucleotide--dimethylbenzimidazole phosphoribosyltransferase [Phaeovibrio sulfidiphilus]